MWRASRLDGEAMTCPFDGREMIKTEELCWDPGELQIKENLKVYSDRFTCPKCKHYERANFRYPNFVLKDWTR